MSVASASGALVGGVVSAYVPAGLLLVTTAGLATVAALLMFLPARVEDLDPDDRPPFNVPVVCIAGFAIGLVIGLNGAGAFLMMPTLIYLVGLPTRIALGTVLAVGFPTSLAASIGKFATGQVPIQIAAIVVLGAIVGAQIGSWLSARTPPRVLRWLYGALVSVIAIGLWWDIFNVAVGHRLSISARAAGPFARRAPRATAPRPPRRAAPRSRPSPGTPTAGTQWAMSQRMREGPGDSGAHQPDRQHGQHRSAARYQASGCAGRNPQASNAR